MLISNNTELITKLFKICKDLNDECLLILNKEQIIFNIMTLDNTTYTVIKLFKSNFSKFEVTEEHTIKFSANYAHKIMKKSKKEDTLYISFNEDKSILKFTLTNQKRKLEYEVRLIELPTDEEEIKELKVKTPELEHKNSITTNNKELLDIIDSLVFQKQSVYIQSEEDKLLIKEEDKSLGNTKISLKDFTEEGYKEKTIVKFGLDLFRRLVEHSSLLAERSLYKLRTEYPLKIITFTPQLEMVSILAPRIENKDD
jgi:hypothetical protein